MERKIWINGQADRAPTLSEVWYCQAGGEVQKCKGAVYQEQELPPLGFPPDRRPTLDFSPEIRSVDLSVEQEWHPASKEPPNTHFMWGRWLEETGRIPIPVLYREPCILVTPGLDTEGIVTTVESNYFHSIPYFCLYSINRHWLETQLQHLLALQSWWNYLTFISLNFFICKMLISAK